MSTFYHKVYYTLCESGRQRKSEYNRYSGLHKHHIIPKHLGGNEDDHNYTYLSMREHIIAHFLLWKMYRNPNDLRSMKMLGAKLTYQQRKIIGLYCRDNNIGIFGASEHDKRNWENRNRNNLIKIGKKSFLTKTAMYGISQEKRRLAIEKSMCTQKKDAELSDKKNFYFYSTAEGRSYRSHLGGQFSPKFPATNGNKTIKFYTEEDRTIFLENNTFWKPGQHWTGGPKKGSTLESKRVKVTDGITIFESVKKAAETYNVTPSAIVYKCKSKSSKNINWTYV